MPEDEHAQADTERDQPEYEIDQISIRPTVRAMGCHWALSLGVARSATRWPPISRALLTEQLRCGSGSCRLQQ